MKLIASLFSFVLFVATVRAQASFIRLPVQGTTVQWNQNVVVQVVRPVSPRADVRLAGIINPTAVQHSRIPGSRSRHRALFVSE
jgi:hypothetical protein